MMRAHTNIYFLGIPFLLGAMLMGAKVEKTESVTSTAPKKTTIVQESKKQSVQKKTAKKGVEKHTKTQASEKGRKVNRSNAATQNVKKPEGGKRSTSAQVIAKSSPATHVASAQPKDKGQKKSKAPKEATLVASNNVPEDVYEVDRVVAKIYAPEETISILASDIKPSLDGSMRTREDIVFEHLVCLEAKKYRITTEEEDIDKAIAGIQKEHNIDLNQLKQVLRASGYTYEEGREAIGKMRIQAQMYDFKIKQRLAVSDADIEAYYNEHPEMEPASYQIAKAFVPYNISHSSHDLVQELETMVSTNSKLPYVEWQEPFWIEHNSIAQDKMFLTQMEPGQLAGPYDVGDGYELYELVAKKEESLKPLKERYAQIANTLRRPKYEELLAQYKKELFESATIRYT